MLKNGVGDYNFLYTIRALLSEFSVATYDPWDRFYVSGPTSLKLPT